MKINEDLLRSVLGQEIRGVSYQEVASAINEYAPHFDVVTPRRLAHFVAQLAHESGRFRWLKELWGPTPTQERYEGRADLGNVYEGDGLRFRGRGLIQVTGRANYEEFNSWLMEFYPKRFPDVVAYPDYVAQYPLAVLSAFWYWDTRKLNKYADRGDVKAVTRIINGGYNGLGEREDYTLKFEKAFQMYKLILKHERMEPKGMDPLIAKKVMPPGKLEAMDEPDPLPEVKVKPRVIAKDWVIRNEWYIQRILDFTPTVVRTGGLIALAAITGPTIQAINPSIPMEVSQVIATGMMFLVGLIPTAAVIITKIEKVTKELGELFIALSIALEDGKITSDELKQIAEEGKDVAQAVKEAISK